MPLERIRDALHLRQQHNKIVEDNLTRLKALSTQAETRQMLLDGLHPWGSDPSLSFHNYISILLWLCAGILLIGFLLMDAMIGHLTILLLILILAGLGWLMYESNQIIRTHISALEQRMFELQYGLKMYALPAMLSSQFDPQRLLRQLQRQLPLLQQGGHSNDIHTFASFIIETDENKHQALVFEYIFKDVIRIYNEKTQQYHSKVVEGKRWCIAVFEQSSLGIIATTTAFKTPQIPYNHVWRSSDIRLSSQLRLYGKDDMHLAKTMSPTLTLKLSDFFAACRGSLIIHHELNVLCYLTETNLLQVANHDKNIQDISSLRGHLRTLRLASLEHVLTHLKPLLK